MTTEIWNTEVLAARLALHYQPERLLILWHDKEPLQIDVVIKFAYLEKPLGIKLFFACKTSITSKLRAIIFAIEVRLQEGG